MQHFTLLAGAACAALAAGLAAPAASAAEQPSYTLEAAMAQCLKVTDPADRLACYDGLAQAASATPEKRAQATPQSSAPDTQAGAQQKTADAAENAPAPSIAPAQAAAPEQRYVILRADDPKLKAPKDRDGGFFSNAPYDAKIVATKLNNLGVLFIELDNGQIWRALDAPRHGVPKKGSVAHMKPRLTGGWFVKFEDTDEQLRMRRFSLGDN